MIAVKNAVLKTYTAVVRAIRIAIGSALDGLARILYCLRFSNRVWGAVDNLKTKVDPRYKEAEDQLFEILNRVSNESSQLFENLNRVSDESSQCSGCNGCPNPCGAKEPEEEEKVEKSLPVVRKKAVKKPKSIKPKSAKKPKNKRGAK